MDQTGTYVNIMRESLERKQKYLAEILKLTNEQSVIATAEKFDEEQFSELVEKKDVLIDNLNEIDKGFSSVYDRVRIEIQRDPVVYRDELLAIQNLIRTRYADRSRGGAEPGSDGTGILREIPGCAPDEAVQNGGKQVL